MQVKIKLIDGGKIPEYKTKGASCFDCYARLAADEIEVPAGKRVLVNLGFCLGLPDEYEAVIRPRSGYSKQSVDIAIGTIDSDYTGEVKACVVNNTGGTLEIKNGERICQMKIQKSERFSFKIVEELEDTERGDGGFGHTGRM